MVSALEQEFQIKIPDSDLNPRKFESIARIESYVESRSNPVAFLKGFGAYLPSRVVTNGELAPQLNCSPEWILEMSGDRGAPLRRA